MYWTTLEISAPRCALMCYPSSNITYCIACLLCIGVILLNKFNSIHTSHVIQDGRSRHIYWEFGKHDLQTSSGYNEMKI